MQKLATITTQTWNKLDRALRENRDLNNLMIDLGKQYKIQDKDAKFLLDVKRKQFPHTHLVTVKDTNSRLKPTYYPSTNTIVSYKEPWSFMHEYNHAYEKADIWDKIRRALPIKHKLGKSQKELLDSYISDAYLKGNNKSHEIGGYLKNVIEDTAKKKESDMWRLTEELRANARAYQETHKITGKENAEKILQPLSVSDVSYVGHFYPEELNRLLGKPPTLSQKVTSKVNNLNLVNAVKNRVSKIREGMPLEGEQFRIF